MTNVSSWVESANGSGTGFGIENLPYALFRTTELKKPSLGIGIGDKILDLRRCADEGFLNSLPLEIQEACRGVHLNELMALGKSAWSSLRARITELLLAASEEWRTHRHALENLLVPMAGAELLLPVNIGNYTDFYASLNHAENVGRLFRPDQPLFPNYKHVPIAYHGRSSSIVVSGTPIPRPSGQKRPGGMDAPMFGPTQALDFELEIGMLIGSGNRLGEPIGFNEAESHIFGVCLVNDWSARDIQSWEYQPLGPFLSKSFATTVSPWIVPMAALEPYRVPLARSEGDPPPLAYLQPENGANTIFDVVLEAELSSLDMRRQGYKPLVISKSNLKYLYWSLPQLVTHHASNGCNLLPGDLLATGTISGKTEDSKACLLELTRNGGNTLELPTGERRTFLELGDEIVIRGWCDREGIAPITLGECRGIVG
ncbi:MAG: fumarylacetoacetase [Bryobacteraceae bacterium]